MKVTFISKNKFDSLEPFVLPNTVLNTEGTLYLYHEKDKWNSYDSILKKFYVNTGLKFGNKLQTINSLIDSMDTINIPSIIFPSSLAVVSGEVVGFIMPFVPSANLGEVLKDGRVDNKTKLSYLKQVGAILDRMSHVRRYTDISDFYLNDLHEGNFIIDYATNRVMVIDIDSCKINHNRCFESKYLSSLSNAMLIPKYERDNDFICGGCFKINEDTEMYCYCVMILNFLYGSNINQIPLEKIYDFLNYLDMEGVDRELLSVLSEIYSNNKNRNPYLLLDSLDSHIDKIVDNSYTRTKFRVN